MTYARETSEPSNAEMRSTGKLALCQSVVFLTQFGVPTRLLLQATQRARLNNTTAASELIAHRRMTEKKYHQLLAKHLNVPFLAATDIRSIELPYRNPLAALHPNSIVWGYVADIKRCAIIAPSPQLISELETLVTSPDYLGKVAITSPTTLRIIVGHELEDELTKYAVKHLEDMEPHLSARLGANALQGVVLTLFIALIGALGLKAPDATAVGLHITISVFFISCISLRLLATIQFRRTAFASIKSAPSAHLPTYSVIVALRDEADVIPDLIRAMRALEWPRSKLEIKLICEADDMATIRALETQDLDARFEIIKVPISEPRTKPKALCYALNHTTGQFISLYDAEDRPHPEQLLEAHTALQNGDENLACVQAPLQISNAHRSFWTALFHFEYAGLFRGLLPWLARHRFPILLGGTSNHFKRDALLNVGAWDPFNVTEDADLGLRLWRKGYRVGMISRPTLEDAPLDFKTWLPQRTRWIKGWMQTWIVHHRQFIALRSNMTFREQLISQILISGTLASVLAHPILLAKALWLTYLYLVDGALDDWTMRLAIFDWSILLSAYISFWALGWRSTDAAIFNSIKLKVLLVPLYWFAISIAAWRALFQLFLNPFHWEKTPHAPHEK